MPRPPPCRAAIRGRPAPGWRSPPRRSSPGGGGGPAARPAAPGGRGHRRAARRALGCGPAEPRPDHRHAGLRGHPCRHHAGAPRGAAPSRQRPFGGAGARQPPGGADGAARPARGWGDAAAAGQLPARHRPWAPAAALLPRAIARNRADDRPVRGPGLCADRRGPHRHGRVPGAAGRHGEGQPPAGHERHGPLVDPAQIPTQLRALVAEPYFDARFFAASAHGRQMAENEAFRWLIRSSVRNFHGEADEAIRQGIGRLAMDCQRAMGHDQVEAISTARQRIAAPSRRPSRPGRLGSTGWRRVSLSRLAVAPAHRASPAPRHGRGSCASRGRVRCVRGGGCSPPPSSPRARGRIRGRADRCGA